MTTDFDVSVKAELQCLLPKPDNQNILCVVNNVENPTTYTQLFSNVQQLFVFTESSNTYKKLNEQLSSSSVKTILNCAQFNNAELQSDLFDTAILIKSFNQLNSAEKQKSVKNLLSTLKVNGHIFVYESEWTKINEQTTNPVDLIHYLNSALVGEKEKFGFEFIFARPLRSYVQFKHQPFHICYLFKKISKTDDHTTLQDFLDQQQYSRNGVLRYERIFGPGFVSTGGLVTTKEFLETLSLKQDQLVLDVGCGIGGGDIYMAQNYSCSVIGVDLSTNMIGIAYERLLAMTDTKLEVSFEIGDIMHHEFAPNSFDVIYSRDTILHITDKMSLFSRLYGWLKPGGQIFITDYTCAPKNEWSNDYQEYVKQRRYTLLTVPEYGKVLESAGFTEVKAHDATEKFVQCLKMELARIELAKDDFIKEFSAEDYHHLIEGWDGKLERCAKGDQRWGVFHGKK